MKHTLLLRLAGPMQAWGVQSRFSLRDSLREPTKSGVIGLICCALGRDRKAAIDDIATMGFGVMVEKEGIVQRDYHTAQNVLVADASLRTLEKRTAKTKATELSERFYLSDAHFIVGFESEDKALLECIDLAMTKPRWPLFLGRKSFVPGLPIRIVSETGESIGIRKTSLVKALQNFVDPLISTKTNEKRRIVADEEFADQLLVVSKRVQPDNPVSYMQRNFRPRRVVIGTLR